MSDDLAARVGRLLRSRRELRRLSQARLAQRAGLTQQRLSTIERGGCQPRLAELERLFAGLGLAIRLETSPLVATAHEDPDLLLTVDADERAADLWSFTRLLDRFHDVPHLVGGRLAGAAHGLPIRVRRLDLLIPEPARPAFAEAVRRFSTVRWSERWQEFCDDRPPERPGPLRWLISGSWELRGALLPELPAGIAIALPAQPSPSPPLPVPSMPWLLANDPDVADLVERLRAAGWRSAQPITGPRPE